MMLISEFATVTGLSRDTIRFYIRLGLLQPGRSNKGGRNPYQFFGKADVQAAGAIRNAQSLGMSLKEVADLLAERREQGIDEARRLELLQRQLERLQAKEAELKTLTSFLQAKINWLSTGKVGPKPVMAIGSCALEDEDEDDGR